jgi:predicted HTH domain antitoxin
MEKAVTEKRAGAWELEQLNQLYQYRPDLVSAALHRLMEQDAELRWALVVTAYLNRQINLGKAAELLSTHELELRDRFAKLGIPLRVGAADVAQAQAEVRAVQSWFSELPDAK